jgi:O-succinylbenzoate synthase
LLQEVAAAAKNGDWDRADLPSLRFAVSCARKPWRFPEAQVRCNGLWIPTVESVAEVEERTRTWEQLVLKVKPGAVPDVQALRSLLERRPDVRFRIDGNRQWSVEQTVQLVSELPTESVEYLEEPLRDPADYEKLWSRCAAPVALDETLLEPGGMTLAQQPDVVALVLKPTLLGDGTDCAPWRQLAGGAEKQLVWSSCFESGVGIQHLACLAAGGAPAGLDTGGWFEANVTEPGPLVVDGVLSMVRKPLIQRAFLHALT